MLWWQDGHFLFRKVYQKNVPHVHNKKVYRFQADIYNLFNVDKSICWIHTHQGRTSLQRRIHGIYMKGVSPPPPTPPISDKKRKVATSDSVQTAHVNSMRWGYRRRPLSEIQITQISTVWSGRGEGGRERVCVFILSFLWDRQINLTILYVVESTWWLFRKKKKINLLISNTGKTFKPFRKWRFRENIYICI